MYRLLALLALLSSCVPASADFVGRLELAPADCQSSGKCRLVYDFGYYDPGGIGWQAKAGDITDGASIPTLAQPFIGGPWDKSFIRAAVLHDHYCDRTVRERTQTHRMFYDALIESGVSRVKAGVMYYAVLVGSHMWVKLMEGEPCSGMKICIRNVGGSLSIPGATIRTNAAGQKEAYRPPRFDDPAVRKDIDDAGALIMTGNFENSAAIEALAKQRNPTDFFLNNGDWVAYEDPSSKYPTE